MTGKRPYPVRVIMMTGQFTKQDSLAALMTIFNVCTNHLTLLSDFCQLRILQ